jgi:hypothetical protein
MDKRINTTVKQANKKKQMFGILNLQNTKDANVCNDIFEATGNSFNCTKKGNHRPLTQ